MGRIPGRPGKGPRVLTVFLLAAAVCSRGLATIDEDGGSAVILYSIDSFEPWDENGSTLFVANAAYGLPPSLL